ncbi:TolC family protein [Chitinophaga sancti]|uniref:Outer membrane protein TolC n=1 Tax=Chitinophaga sancti TaxID=1004 RepID=A0A1K1MA11_9BACT|nr:TolC family protein [Chitinophaga sancti]WQD64596.1 TolC family protein [Chitinophaga sancti]WQG89780.1 TolC family protein [Chitinophaga sancti]SFW18774.1 Outer membrane protein TolC [Chitinophaga sancti]
MKGYQYLRLLATGLLVVCCLSTQKLIAQRAISIREALSLVQSQQPQLNSFKEQATAAGHNISIARNALIPDVTVAYQAGFATYNNITGMSYPGLILPISGPPSAGNSYEPVPGSALTALLKWNPVTFGQRQASIEKATAQFKLANSYYDEALFRQQYAAIAVYLDAVYLQKLVQSHQANIDRTETGLQQSLVYAKEGLRPGIDTTQFQAALAQAKTDLLLTERQYYAQVTELSRLIGLNDQADKITLSDTLVINKLPYIADTAISVASHPFFLHQQARKVVSEAALKEIERSWRPKLDLWANAYGRGSGVSADGTLHKSDGWSLTRSNYGVGIQVSFPILQFSLVNKQKKQFASLVKADEAQLSQLTLDLQKQQQTAQFNYRQDVLIARQSIIQAQSANDAFTGLKLSYASGLIDFTRLIQGQYDLLKAETGKAGAFLQTWHALLDIAVTNGNLDEFTNKMK